MSKGAPCKQTHHASVHAEVVSCSTLLLYRRLWLEHVWEPDTEGSGSVDLGGDPQPASYQSSSNGTVPSGPSPINITVFTHLSLGRLEQLEQQCLSWLGPLSAAAYLPLLSTAKAGPSSWKHEPRPDWYQPAGATLDLPEASQQAVQEALSLLDLFVARWGHCSADVPPYISQTPPDPCLPRCRMAKAGRCQLTLSLYWQLFSEASAASYMYPINALRNLAALMVSGGRREGDGKKESLAPCHSLASLSATFRPRQSLWP
jgi:hypothetical protein